MYRSSNGYKLCVCMRVLVRACPVRVRVYVRTLCISENINGRKNVH